jgi:hypothetical protein
MLLKMLLLSSMSVTLTQMVWTLTFSCQHWIPQKKSLYKTVPIAQTIKILLFQVL